MFSPKRSGGVGGTEVALKREREILAAARVVHERLGKHRSVEDYEYELTEELRMRGIDIRRSQRTQIFFGSTRVGIYMADLVLDGRTLIEIKHADCLTEQEKRAFGAFIREVRYQRGYLMNFAADDLEVEQFAAE